MMRLQRSLVTASLGVFCISTSETAFSQSVPADWTPISVPGAWEANGPPAAGDYDGFAWYRTWVKPDDSFFIRHERNLFEESVIINIRDLADAYEVFVNGKRIGTAGQFPPRFRSGRNEIHRHKVPVGTLKKGMWNEVAVRVYNRAGPGGFLSEAPFIMNYFMECVLEGEWLFQLGDRPDLVSGPLRGRPEASAFDSYHESHRVLGEAAEYAPGKKLSPTESLAGFQAADDLAVELLLSEPRIAQPVHFSFDERGRLWLAEYRQYPYPAGLRMLSRDKYYRSHYDKIPPAPPNHERGRDVLSIHEDTDGDGAFDSHKVFLDGLNMANAALRGRGGVWVMHTPYLLFYPDADFDDRPDGPPEVRLRGFGLEDSHSVANGLVWGMDGWLYGAQGSTTTSRVTRPGIDPPDAPGVYFEGCMVWRYHPETREYEIFAEGTGNTFGLEIDAQGRLFSGHNGGDTRGWHYVQGGFYLMQGVNPGKFGPPRNPYAFGDLPMMRTANTVRRFSHFAAVVEGTALPWKYAGNFFALDPIHSVVIGAERRVRGATFETEDIGPVLSSSDEAFRPVYIANAPDGSLFIADMYEYYIAHGQHYQNQIDHSTGRLYRLRGKDLPLEKPIDLGIKSTDELIELLRHSNKWHRHTAVRILGERKDSNAVPRLQESIKRETGHTALCALWALHQLNGLDPESIVAGLNHSYAPVRMWTVRLLGDRWGTHPGLGLAAYSSAPQFPDANALPEQMFGSVLDQARRETDPEVRSQMASSARRLPAAQGLRLAAALLEHDEDVNDPYIPPLCWWILEANVASHQTEVLELFETSSFWDRSMVFEHILPRLMRRFALEGRRRDLLVCANLLRMAPAPRHAGQLMEGFGEAYRGRSISGLPAELVDAMAAAGRTSLIVRIRQGDETAVANALEILGDAKRNVEERLLYARIFGEVRNDRAVPVLLAVAEEEVPDELRKAALASVGAYGDRPIGSKISVLLESMPLEVRMAAIAVLASRSNWSLDLLHAVRDGRLSRTEIPDDVLARMRSHNDRQTKELIGKLFPVGGRSESAGFQERMARIQSILANGTGNPYTGEAVFMERCAGCHKLFFKGGRVGPDLTNYQRDDFGTMLTSLLDPDLEIREGYEYYLVETKDGRSLSGFLVDRDERVSVLRGLEDENINLRQTEIEEIRPMGRSLMPKGLLDDLDEQRLRDFFAYLRISQPITQ